MDTELQTLALERRPAEVVPRGGRAGGHDEAARRRSGEGPPGPDLDRRDRARHRQRLSRAARRQGLSAAGPSSSIFVQAPSKRRPGPAGAGRCVGHGHRFRRPADGGRQPPRLRPSPERRGPPHRPRPRQPVPAHGVPQAVLRRHARNRLLDPHQRPASAPGDRLAARLRLLDPRPRPLPCQRVLPARLARRRLPADPLRAELDRRPRPARGRPRDDAQAARLRARHRPHRLRQVHLAGGDDRRDQHHPRGAHPDDRGPDRVPARAQEVHRQPARAGRRRDELRRGPEGRAAPGPRRDPGRRDARPRDDQRPP